MSAGAPVEELSRATAARRPTIGFLVDNLFDGFEQALWSGVIRAAEAHDTNLLLFLGGSLSQMNAGRSRPRWGRNGVYDLVSPERVDGLIVLSASLGCFLTAAEFAGWLRRFDPLPVVSLCMEVPGATNLLVDGGAGVSSLIDHLVQEHGRRRIAFVAGPPSNGEAIERLAAYRAGLARHGLPFDPGLVCPGEFDRASGRRAVELLVDERRVAFDALLGANDYSALYAMHELVRRGIRVPEAVSVAGFDDIPDANSIHPSLTTVRQPLGALADLAVRSIVQRIAGGPPGRAVLPTQPVIRRSCGCDPVATRREPSLRRPEVAAPEAQAPVSTAAQLRGAFPDVERSLADPEWADALCATLLDGLEAALEDGDAGPFVRTVERLVSHSLAHGGEADRWYEVMRALQAVTTPAASGPALSRRIEGALTSIGLLAVQAQTAERLKADEEGNILLRLFLPTHLSFADAEQVLRSELPSLGISTCFLCRTDQLTSAASLSVHFDAEGLVELEDPAPAVFAPARLVPGQLTARRRWSFAVLPLHYLEERIGFLLCSVGPMGCAGYEWLTSQLGTVFKVTALMQEVQAHADGLEVKVAERTRELREAQQQLLETAHQAGMAEVAVGVLHNVGNLLNSVNVCAEELSAAAKRAPLDGLVRANGLVAEHRGDLGGFFSRDPRAALLPAYYERVAAGIGGELGRIRTEARELVEKTSLIRESIKTLQEFARDGTDALLRDAVEIPDLLEAALDLQAAYLARYRVRLVREIRAMPAVVTHRSRVVHVVVNLVKNAVEAMRGVPEPDRVVTVRAGAESGGLVEISVSDTGEGIPAENLDRIFAYGFTTKVDGNGFGLHTAANTMSQLGGAIRVQSGGLGCGATFTVSLPIDGGAA